MVSGGEDEVEVSVAVLVCRRLHSVDAGVRVRPIDIEPPAGVVDVVAVGIYELGSGEGAVPVPGEHPEARAMRAPGARYECQVRSEEHTSELQSLMRISYAVFCLKKKTQQ